MAQARSLLAKDPRQWTRDTLAEAVGMSPAHLSRRFSSEFGLSLTDHRNHLRLVKATEALREGDLNVTDVAFEAGFGSYPQFHRVFLKTMGCTPAQWRKGL